MPIATLICALFFVACGGDDSDSDSSSGGRAVTITLWHGQGPGPGTDEFDRLVAEFNKAHPKIKVKASPGVAGSETILEKTTAALAGGDPPNIAYSFGSNVANVASSPQAVDLTDTVEESGWDWDSFYPAYRDGVMLDDKVKAIPGPGDSLAILYNKELFKAAGVDEPQEGWTWDDYRAAAKRLTDSSKGVYGAAFQSGGGLDSTWPFWPMVWQRGGEVLDESGEEVGWNNDSGLQALEFLRGLAQDKSVYADTSPGYPKMLKLFLNGKVAMYEGDPWQLPGAKDAKLDYGVAKMPSTDGNATTIVGPDAWVVFDHGKAANDAAAEFLKWFTQPKQDAKWNAATGNLPSRNSTVDQPAWQAYAESTPGIDVFTEQLADGKVVPRIKAYAAISDALGVAIQSSLIKLDSNLEDDLSQAADKANNALKTTP